MHFISVLHLVSHCRLRRPDRAFSVKTVCSRQVARAYFILQSHLQVSTLVEDGIDGSLGSGSNHLWSFYRICSGMLDDRLPNSN